MTRWDEGDVVANGLRLHYRRGGQGPTILLLHGVAGNGLAWGRVADALARGHDIILLDQRGHGRSAAPPSGYRLADFAADAVAAIDLLRAAPVAIMGHSLGARVALAVAARRPDLVARVVLEDPPLDAGLDPAQGSEEDANRERYDWFA